ncbi:THAP domain-containing protein 9 [Plakobranchus ocellatus]|uniref:THAP domain-containing protein 9 n=1 Tax=Plakobranchus ocellatus TaxID=259542 RepID=A0AAV3YNL1_9GAST|nr:THAP domain-containing protein 9 [Plakobranchus ocellatus]
MGLHRYHKHQSEDSLYFLNKLSSKYISFGQVKMKVSIAAQILSSSVVRYLDHLRDDLHVPAFHGSKKTYEFIRIIDELFDRLNVKKLLPKDTKQRS